MTILKLSPAGTALNGSGRDGGQTKHPAVPR